MLALLLLFGLLLATAGVLARRKGWKVIGGVLAVVGGLLALFAVVVFVIALLSFHP